MTCSAHSSGVVPPVCRISSGCSGTSYELDIPVKYIGVGEKLEDFKKFDADEYVDSLFEGMENA